MAILLCRDQATKEKMRTPVFLFALLVSFSVQAQVVKCMDANGNTIYSDVACPSSASSSSVNLTGGNITEDQVQAAKERRADNARNAAVGAQCQLLMNQAHQTFSSFLERTNPNRWSISFQALQTLASACASPETCQLVKARLEHSQQRYSQDNTPTRGGQLNSVTSLYAESCLSGGARQGGGSPPSAETSVNPRRTYWTKDQFGTAVKSDSCFWTKDAFGTSVRSAGCSK